MGLLKSKIVVGALALIAVGVVFKNVVLPIFGFFETTAAPVKLFSAPALSVSASAVAAPKTQLKDLAWILDIKKDPFKTIQHLPDRIVKSVLRKARPKSRPGKAKPVKKEQEFTLVGVVVEPDGRFAVINDEVVAEGDRYKGYEVVKIHKDSVLLKGRDSYRTLRF